ncbi:MAG: 30S ribosomal protein S12 methylthiotransferase RimO [Clostridia bacterium]|nr:30S ribosomal protein S12 methylthiotransferase RimO [Clostridia bacterium]
MEKIRVGVISLGCDKNRVDTEKMLGILSDEFLIVDNPESADVIIINTCAFLESARKEAIEEILWASALKGYNPNLKLIVTGCLPQKFVGDIFEELPEVDAFLGVSDYADIKEVIHKTLKGQRVNSVGEPRGECGTHRILTTNGYAYLKIADGCSNHCTYCLIPSIRGKYRSVQMNDLLLEAKSLGKTNELILVAQDVTKYGLDLTPKTSIVELIKELSKLDNICHIRLLYCYPESVSDELIEEIRNNPKVIKYIDMPLQHADDTILKLMNRKGSFDGYLALVNKLKERVPTIAIRSTFITGFPGETEQAHERLIEFLQKAKLFNAGFFAYSREQGTPAYKLPDQIDGKTKNKRLRALYSAQKKVVKQNLKEYLGKTISVVCEGFDQNALVYYGRAYFNAPDIDGKIYFFSADEIEYGKYYDIKIQKVDGYDLYGDRL